MDAIIQTDKPEQPLTSASIRVTDNNGQMDVIAEFGGLDFDPTLPSHAIVNQLLHHMDTLAKPIGEPQMLSAADLLNYSRDARAVVEGG